MKAIGTIIKEELERQERTVTWFARKLSCDRSNVYCLFQKHSIDTALLSRISVILNRDFFAELSENFQSTKLREDWDKGLVAKIDTDACQPRNMTV